MEYESSSKRSLDKKDIRRMPDLMGGLRRRIAKWALSGPTYEGRFGYYVTESDAPPSVPEEFRYSELELERSLAELLPDDGELPRVPTQEELDKSLAETLDQKFDRYKPKDDSSDIDQTANK